MLWVLLLLAAPAFGPLLRAESNCPALAPCYVASSITNAASNIVGAFAPNTFLSIYGTNLSYSTRGIAPQDIRDGRLPISLGGVSVRIGPSMAPVYYVSPTQVNVLIPSDLLPGWHELRMLREGWSGPGIQIKLSDAAPALFQISPEYAVATHADYEVITEDSPARPGETVILYATGLGRNALDTPTSNFFDAQEIPNQAVWIQRMDEFHLWLDGAAADRWRLAYVGLAPGFAGLYQINLILPESAGVDPEIRISLGDQISPEGLRLLVRPR